MCDADGSSDDEITWSCDPGPLPEADAMFSHAGFSSLSIAPGRKSGALGKSSSSVFAMEGALLAGVASAGCAAAAGSGASLDVSGNN